MADVMSQERGRLVRIAVIVEVLAGMATIVGVVWTIISRETTEIADYRREATATCAQVASIVGAAPQADGVSIGPGGYVLTNRQRFLDDQRRRLELSRTAFETLGARPHPSQLSDARTEAIAAQDAWYVTVERSIELLRERLRRGDALSAVLQPIYDEAGYPSATVRLNSAMSAIGEAPCRIGG